MPMKPLHTDWARRELLETGSPSFEEIQKENDGGGTSKRDFPRDVRDRQVAGTDYREI